MRKALPEIQIAGQKENQEAKTLMKKKQWEIWSESTVQRQAETARFFFFKCSLRDSTFNEARCRK